MIPLVPKIFITAKITTNIGSTKSIPMSDIMSFLQQKWFLQIALDIGIAINRDIAADKKAWYKVNVITCIS